MKTNPIRHISLWILVACAASMFMACGTPKTVINGDNDHGGTPTAFSPKKHFEKVVDNHLNEKALSAKIKCTIEMDGNNVSTSGQLRMKRNEAIQIILLDPLIGAMELGRMEFTTDRLTIIDRYNKRYIDVPYEEVAFLQRCNVSFSTLQHLFWNEVFVPTDGKLEYGQFALQSPHGDQPQAGDKVTLATQDNLLSYQFLTEQNTGRLTQTTITGTDDKNAKFAFKYGDFKAYQGKDFPCDMTMAFIMGNQNASISFSLSSLKSKANWDAKTQIPSKYKKVDAEKIFKSLFNL